MKHIILVTVYLLIYSISHAQQQESMIAAIEQQGEIIADKDGVEMEDDSFILQLENFKKHPLNLNEAESDDLKKLLELSDLQIENFLIYRRLFGKLLNIYELQAVPTWNLSIIKKLLPFITVERNANLADNIKERWHNGNNDIILRTSKVLEKAAGYFKDIDTTNYFLGSGNRLMMRYAYNYRNLLQWGILGDKDAGEPFFKGRQKTGFDFYSFHFFLAKMGMLKALAVGNFTVNMGQGLIQWQGLAFTKSSEITSVKRQSAVLRPYTSAGEYNFHRGAGITLQKGKWEGTLFFSFLTLSGNLVKDFIGDAGHISSISSTGYHRTPKEEEGRSNLQQITSGGSIKYSSNNWHLALNTVVYKFSLPLKKEPKPYNLFAASGTGFKNASIDYSYTYKNVHFFGELATDKVGHTALLNGLIASLSQSLDLSLLYRSIDKRYQSFYANAFTENTDPNNEKGFYAGISMRPSENVQINAFTDRFNFPWLKYRVDAPSSGREYFLQVLYSPNKSVEISTHFRNEWKQQNVSRDAGFTIGALENIKRQNWRMQVKATLNRSVSLRSRAEVIFYNRNQPDSEEGFMMFTDILYKTPLKHLSGNIRLQYFETTGYNSRLYAFENDILYSFSIPVTYDKGYRYYINLHADISKYARIFFSKNVGAGCWLRLARTLFSKKESVGSGPDEITGNKKTEIKFQILLSL
jgi:hypothetical protein